MFNKLIKIFHDGFLIIEDGEVLYANEQAFSLFEVKDQDL